MSELTEIKLDDVTYVRKDLIQSNKADQVDEMDYVIVRTISAGVFAGYMESRNGAEITLVHVRRLWYWDGAASLSQLSVDGVSKPKTRKFPCEMQRTTLTEAIEIIECTEKARISIAEVAIWES